MSSSVVGALRVNLGLDAAQFTQGLRAAEGRMANFGKRMQVVGAAVTAVGTGVALAIRGQLNAADALAKMSDRIGVPVEALSQLQFAAELSAVSLSDLETGLRGLSRNMVENADGFAAVGIALRDAEGVMRPTEAVLADLADVLAGMPEGAERTALAMELMGRSGAQMLPLLTGGADAMRAMMQEADALGLTISEDTARAAQEFNDNLTRLQRTVTGIWRQMSAQLAPVLEQISAALVSVAGVFRDLSPEAQRFLGVAGGLTVVLGPVLVAAGLLVTAMSALSAPVLAAVAAFALLSAGLAALWPRLVELKDQGLEAVNSLVDGFWAFKESAEMAVVSAIDRIVVAFNEWVEWARGLPAQFIQIGRDIIQGLADGIFERWDALRGRVTGVFDGLTSSVRDLFSIRSPSMVFQEIGQFLMDGLANGISRGGVKVKDVLADLARQMSGTLMRAGLGKLFGAVFPGMNFGGFRADGGPVSAGRAYVVGERGPELFVPRGAGQIVPNGAAASVHIVARVDTGVILDVAQGAAVRVTREALTSYDRQALPARVAQINRDPSRRG